MSLFMQLLTRAFVIWLNKLIMIMIITLHHHHHVGLLMQWQTALQYKWKVATIWLPVTNNVNVQITQKYQ